MATSRKPSVFLSHSSADKKIVERIGALLASHGVVVWVDNTGLRAGTGIVRSLEEAVTECDFLILFLTPKSVSSGWVRKEWQTKLVLHIKEDRNRIIPLLIEDCEIPLFLKDIKCVDFRKNFENGISHLLSGLQMSEGPVTKHATVLGYTEDFLEDIEDQVISLPFASIPILDTLKRLPRSGKSVRLERYAKPVIPIRSIYDHILSVAHSADCLMPEINHGMSDHETSELARCIAYHELNEVVLGDIPAWTNLNERKRSSARVFAEERLRSVRADEREKITNQFIGLFLDNKQRESIKAVDQLFQKSNSRVTTFFWLLDKIDPIVAVWRYLHVFRGRMNNGPSDFLRRLRDFFQNADVKRIARDFKQDQRVYDLVVTLQDRKKAESYYKDRDLIFGQRNLFGIPNNTVQHLIEGRKFLYAKKDR